jgi:hypothetical protein
MLRRIMRSRRWVRVRRFERVGIIRFERARPGNNAQN